MKKVFGVLAAVVAFNAASAFACDQEEVVKQETTQEVVVQETEAADAAE